MTVSSPNFGLPELRRPKLNASILVTIVLCAALLGSALVFRFAAAQEERDLARWQNKLGLIADSRAAAIDEWLANQFKELAKVASNPSLQLYLTDILSQHSTPENGAPPQDSSMQAVFLRNMILLTADRLDFLNEQPAALQEIHANIAQPSSTGLALFDPQGKSLLGTTDFAAADPALHDTIVKHFGDKPALIDLFATADNAIHIGFVFPIFPIQKDSPETKPFAYLVGIKEIDDAFFQLLRTPGLNDKDLEAVLLRKEAGQLVYLSPYEDRAPLSARFSVDTPDLDAAFAVTTPDSFAVKKDGKAQPMLVTSRALHNAPWTVMLHIAKQHALAENMRWAKQTQAIMVMALVAFIWVLIAVWYYGTSKRSQLQALQMARMASRLAAQEKLMRIVANNHMESVLLVDAHGAVLFGNDKAAESLRISGEDMVGKTLPALMGPAQAVPYEESNAQVLDTQTPLIRLWEKSGDLTVALQTVHIPLQGVPSLKPEETSGLGVLIIEQDISTAVQERDRHLAAGRQLVNALVNMVDDRDPYAAHHGAGVALVASAVAQEMGLDPRLVATAEVAGRLMNIGKVMVPRDLLAKPTSLDDDEKQNIRESLQRAFVFLQGIAFDGPVVETLRQMQERMDGAGPLRVKGEDILITARVIAVANAFVGMISPRAYRPALDKDKAISLLLQDSDTGFDRRVVVALANFVENRKGQETLIALLKV